MRQNLAWDARKGWRSRGDGRALRSPQVVRCNGRELLPHVELLRKVLHRTLHLSSRKGYLLASTLLRNMLRACTMVFPLDYRSTHRPWEECLDFASYLPTRVRSRPPKCPRLNSCFAFLPSTDNPCCANTRNTCLDECRAASRALAHLTPLVKRNTNTSKDFTSTHGFSDFNNGACFPEASVVLRRGIAKTIVQLPQ